MSVIDILEYVQILDPAFENLGIISVCFINLSDRKNNLGNLGTLQNCTHFYILMFSLLKQVIIFLHSQVYLSLYQNRSIA